MKMRGDFSFNERGSGAGIVFWLNLRRHGRQLGFGNGGKQVVGSVKKVVLRHPSPSFGQPHPPWLFLYGFLNARAHGTSEEGRRERLKIMVISEEEGEERVYLIYKDILDFSCVILLSY